MGPGETVCNICATNSCLTFGAARAGLEWPWPVATWRPVDLATWAKSAGRQVVKSRGRQRGAFPAPRPGVQGAGHNLAFKPGISAESNFVNAKHFLPRSLREAPKRETRPRARRQAAGAGRIGIAAARGRTGRRTRTTRRRADGTTGISVLFPKARGAERSGETTNAARDGVARWHSREVVDEEQRLPRALHQPVDERPRVPELAVVEDALRLWANLQGFLGS